MMRIFQRSRKCERSSRPCRVLLVVLAMAAGCGHESQAPPLPTGAWIYADAAAVREILASLQSLHDTPMADRAAALQKQIAGCDAVEAHTDSGDLARWFEALRCASASEIPDSIVALRGDAAAAVSFEVSPGTHWRGTLARSPAGDLIFDASLATPESQSLAALLLPSEEPPGPPVLGEGETVLHARVRPQAGLNIASWIAEDSQADNLFRLRSELFLGQVLDGTWEVAVYLPREDQVTPPMALGLDYSLRPAAKAAMEAFVTELESTWPIHHSDLSVAGFEGACFHDVRLLPDLAPCYVLTERSIVVGWNRISLDLALASNGPEGATRDASVASHRGIGPDGGAVLHLGRLPEADRRLQHQLLGGIEGPTLDYVWDELRVSGFNDGRTLRVRVSLEMGGAS